MEKGMKTERKVKWLLFFSFLLFLGWLSKDASVPLIYPDEAGYIGWAKIIAGKSGDPLHYSPGYSLLLAPIFLFTEDILQAYPVIIKINVMIGALIPVLLYHLSGYFCNEKDVLKRAGIAVLASLYPTVTSYVQLALSETWLTVLLLGVAVCFCSLWENRNQLKIWGLLLVLCIWSVLTHARGLAIGIGALLTAVVLFRDKKKELIIGGLIGILMIGGTAAVLLSDQDHIGACHVLNQIKHFFSIQGISSFVTTLISHFCYLIWSTFGMISIAIYRGVTAIRKQEKGWGLWVFILSSFCFMWCLSAFYMSHHERAVHILYGRYIDVVIPLILLALFSGWGKVRIPWWIWIISLGCVIVTGLLYSNATLGLDGGIMNAVGMFLYRIWLHHFEFWWAAIFFALMTGIVFFIGLRHPSLCLVALGTLFLFQVGYIQNSYFEREASVKRQVPQVIARLPENAEVYVSDLEGVLQYTWQYYNYPLYRPDLKLSTEDTGQPFVLSRTLQEYGTLIAMEKENPVYLYQRDSQVQGLQYPDELEEYNVSYFWRQVSDGIEVTVQNHGSPWLCFNAVRDLRNTVRLGVRCFDYEQNLISDQRYDFFNNLYQGDQEQFLLSVPSQCSLLEIQPVLEFTAWFSERGCEPLWLSRQGDEWKITEEPKPDYNHDFRKIEFSHLRYVEEMENTTYQNTIVNFYSNYTKAESKIKNIRMPSGDWLILHTGESEQREVKISVNDRAPIRPERYEDGAYYIPLEDTTTTITSIGISSDTVNPFDESGLPDNLSFLSLDTNVKPIQFAVHRMEDIMGREVNNHEFGIRIEKIEVRREE